MIQRNWHLVLTSICVAIGLGATASAALAQTVKDVFEKLDLIGRYAIDCKQPNTDQNLYIVHRLEGDRVRREQFTGPNNRQFSMLVEQARQSKPSEITYTGQREDGRYTSIMRLDGKRMRVMESTKEGSGGVIAGGRLTNGRDVPWFEKCLGPEVKSVSGVFSPDRINADLEEKAQARQKSDPNPAPRGQFFKFFTARTPAEFAGLARYTVMFQTVLSQKSEELPLNRMFHRAAGSEQNIIRVMSWRSELPASMLARKVYGPYREDGYYLIPSGMLVRDGQLLIDYANVSNVAIAKLPAGPAVEALKKFGSNLDPAPNAKPDLRMLQEHIKYRYPGFPLPTAVP